MKKRAIIYTRVSTDEQADKGYSLKDQEDRLRKFCALKEIEVIDHYQDDHSAKTFDRPAFNKLLEYSKKNKSTIDLIVFLKWDRFSRNAGDSYFMINQFRKLAIECQAIEQPLDLAVPENKMMLAFYLAAPEVENDRRSLNTIHGMRRAMKEGRWMANAPVGYKNARDEKDGAIIILGPQAPLVRKAFQEMATGVYCMEEVRKRLYKEGLKCGRAQFPNLLQNRVYIGKIFMSAFKDEDDQIVQGLHEPLIDEETFYRVQDILKGRKKFFAIITQREQFPLRNFLSCQFCGKKLTGSSSKGRNGGKHDYYHCNRTCHERFRADWANDQFLSEFAKVRFEENTILTYYEFLKETFSRKQHGKTASLGKLKAEIEKNTGRLNSAQQMLLDGGLDLLEYRTMKTRYEGENAALKRELSALERADEKFLTHLEYGTGLIRGVDRHFVKADVSVKQKMLGLFFPNFIVFEKEGPRTTLLCEPVEALCPNHGAFRGDKKRLEAEKCFQSNKAPRAGLEPATP